MSSHMIKVRVLQGFVMSPGKYALPGEIIELPEHTAARERAMGRVANHVPERPASAPETVQTRDPEPQTRDPQIKRGK